ncbi:MAG: efflux RND transporter periplasmic adaptor subunit [Thermovirgaceae bacterium]
MKKWLVITLILLLFGGLVGYRAYQQHLEQQVEPEEDLPAVALTRLKERTIEETTRFTAGVEPESKAAVVARVEGRTVLRVLVDEGDVVDAGDLMAVLDESVVNQQIAEARSAYGTAKADYERYKALYEDEVISRQRLDHARQAFVQARTALEQVRILEGYHSIKAPVAGTVAQRNIDPGDTSSSRMAAFLIFQQERVKVYGGVTERAFTAIKKGQPATVTLDAIPDKKFEAAVSRVSPTLDPATRTGTVEVKLASEGVIKPGMFARVEIRLGERNVQVLAADAIERLAGTGGYICYVLEGDRAVLRNIETGAARGEWVEIVSGLGPEDDVIATLSRKIVDGAKVRVIEQ